MDRLAVPFYSCDVINNIASGPSQSYAYQKIGGWNTMRHATATIGGSTTTSTDDGKSGTMTSASGRYSGLTYDACNRLTWVYDIARAATHSYAYGPDSLRYRKDEKGADLTTASPYYLYEGNSILHEETWKGTVPARTWITLSIYLGGTNVGRYKETAGSEVLQYFYNDHLGSRRAVTEAAGTVQAKIDYSTWGVPSITNYSGYDGSADVSYTGKELDATKLYYFNVSDAMPP